MNKNRLEAFSDGVLAVIITILVLDIKAPQGVTLTALLSRLPFFLTYLLSFVFVAIYWNNHHHLLHATKHVSGAILWANLHLLFWLSLTPFATAWMGEHFAPLPVAFYGVILLMAGFAYYILTKQLIASHGSDSLLASSIGKDRKGALSLLLYAAAIPAAFLQPWLACAGYILVAIIWLTPDPRIERQLSTEPDSRQAS